MKAIDDAWTSVHCSDSAFGNDDLVVWLRNDQCAVGSAYEYACANKSCLTQDLISQHALMVRSQNRHFSLVLCLFGGCAC